MSSRDETTLPITRPRSRKSLAHPPSANIMDKENMTADIGMMRSPKKSSNRPTKKSRSKSIGPGGLDALKNTTGNSRMSIAAQPKSILKPTMPPLQDIPVHGATKKPGQKEVSQLATSLEMPNVSKSLGGESLGRFPAITGANNIPHSFVIEPNSVDNETRVLLRTEEQQKTASRDREDAGNLDARREARRKSLANRRVSFAPEATLHTWDVVEYLQDSTVSSESTNSTRRVSSAPGRSIGLPRTRTPGLLDSDPSEPPSTPPEQVEERAVLSPAHQRGLHQKKRRRSSGIPPLNFNNPDDEIFSSSPSNGSSETGDDGTSPGLAGGDSVEASDSNSDSENDGTAMSLDLGNNTDISIVSARSASSTTGSSARLEEALQLAARQAETQGVGLDDYGHVEAAQDEEVVAQFQPWAKGGKFQILSPSQDQENMNPFSPAFKAGITMEDSGDEGEGMTMEMTQAVGHIIPQEQPDEGMTMEMTASIGGIMQALPDNATGHVPKHSLASRRQSIRRRSSAESSGDQTMDLTMAIGGIQQAQEMDNEQENIIEDEDMSMELTSVISSVLATGKVASVSNQSKRSSVTRRKSSQHQKRESLSGAIGDGTMDTAGANGETSSMNSGVHGHDETVDVEMDMTMAVGGILPKRLGGDDDFLGRSKGQPTTNNADIIGSPSRGMFSPISLSRTPAVTIASETGSPSLAAFRGKGLRRSGVRSTSTTPKSSKTPNAGTPTKKPPTPSKQSTPKRARDTKDISTQRVSLSRTGPRQSDAEGSTPRLSTTKKSSTTNELFQKSNTMGTPVPNIVLTPHKRRSSGIGVDRTGLGSPHVAALLDRRESIGEKATAFTSGSFANIARGVHFSDPQTMEYEVDLERQGDLDREDGRKIMEREADIAEEEKDATINLKEMIQSLTPKKRPLNGRKSLHVGAARGILGKRPAELDQNDQENDDDADCIKRLKIHEGSPVKNVKLKAPPSKAETTGRLTRAARRSLQETTDNNNTTPTMTSSTDNKLAATTPNGQRRFRDPKVPSSAEDVVPFVEKPPLDNPVIDGEDYGDERIQLQDFLNMTSIRFMELTTTKRRHTAVPTTIKDNIGLKYENNLGDTSFESCVVAGACTVPMLELFQHSCRELKKYISEGRGIVREIETETFEENPPLFREYISASPDVRVLMDNQFKIVKTHARLLSKAMWYEWRMKLLEGLKGGLLKISDGMKCDAEIFQDQQELLEGCLPPILEDFEKKAAEKADLQQIADELADCNQEELIDAREKLLSVEGDVEAKQRMIQDMRQRLQEKEVEISAINREKQACLGDIEAAERIREACRGWSASEGLAFKDKVGDLEKRHGWVITGVVGSQVSLTYRRDIELVFDAFSFKPNTTDGPPPRPVSSRIDLWYIAAGRELNPMPLTVEKEFFLQNIRECCRCLPQARTKVKDLLDSVSVSWTRSLEVVGNIRSMNRIYPTEVTKTSDSSILVRSTLLLLPLGTKVVIELNVVAQSTPNGLEVRVQPCCTVLYGERFNEAKMTGFLASRVTGHGKDEVSWGNIIAELEEKLLARGRK